MAIQVDGLLPILKAAYELMQGMTGKQGHVNDIADLAVQHNKNMGMSKEDFAAKLSASLAAHIWSHGSIVFQLNKTLLHMAFAKTKHCV